MYITTDDNIVDLIFSHMEHVVDVFNMRNMRDFLSGDFKKGDFSIITDEYLYIYNTSNKSGTVTVALRVEDVQDITFTLCKSKKSLLQALYALPCAALSFLCTKVASLSMGFGMAGVFGVVFFGIDAFGFAILTVASVIRAFRIWKSEQHTVMHVISKIGITYDVNGNSLSTAEISDFKKSLKSAQFAKRTGNRELFLNL
ncbi:MAG: hypothetical protein IJO93_00075 [Clostridia bacterium]|nr:hypothetical protein [Clostridia bacterium]